MIIMHEKGGSGKNSSKFCEAPITELDKSRHCGNNELRDAAVCRLRFRPSFHLVEGSKPGPEDILGSPVFVLHECFDSFSEEHEYQIRVRTLFIDRCKILNIRIQCHIRQC